MWLCSLQWARPTGEIGEMCGYAHFTGARHIGEIGEVCGYTHFTGQAIQVRLERCVVMLTSRGKLYR